MDKRVLHSVSPLPLILLFLALHFYFTLTYIQVKRKALNKFILPFVVLFVGYKMFSFYFQKGTFLVSVLRKSKIKEI